MLRKLRGAGATMVAATVVITLAACDERAQTPTSPQVSQPPADPPPQGTRLVREAVSGIISTDSSSCSQTFKASVDASYFDGGTGRCVEVARRSTTAGVIVASLSWADRRIDL